MNLEKEYQDKIGRVLRALFPTAKIYFFGSRARGTNSEMSDIDVAIDTGKAERWRDIGEARDMFVESNIPYSIDVVDLNDITQTMRESIKREGIEWNA
jgi:predicted nucleotidyltransferase